MSTFQNRQRIWPIGSGSGEFAQNCKLFASVGFHPNRPLPSGQEVPRWRLLGFIPFVVRTLTPAGSGPDRMNRRRGLLGELHPPTLLGRISLDPLRPPPSSHLLKSHEPCRQTPSRNSNMSGADPAFHGRIDQARPWHRYRMSHWPVPSARHIPRGSGSCPAAPNPLLISRPGVGRLRLGAYGWLQ